MRCSPARKSTRKKPACSHSRTLMMTSQYHGGWVVDSQATGAAPNQPSTVLANPNRTPLKIDIFQISAATTYEQAVGRKKTERKKARPQPSWETNNAKESDSAYVAGTTTSANSANVPRLWMKAGSVSTRT